MPKFENKYIHCVWDDGLKGKKVFYSDSISELRKIVEENDQNHTDVIVDYYAEDYPFSFGSKSYFAFCYCDPNYDLKVQFEKGKKIECKRKGDAWGDLDWDYTPSPAWLDDYEYRIQSEENIVTNHELAQWLAEGYGQYRNSQIGNAKYHFEYASSEDDIPIHKDIRVRVFGDTEWHEPTREYMGLD